MFKHRQFIGTIPVSAVAMSLIGNQQRAHSEDFSSQSTEVADLIASPPVVQNPRTDCFDVSIAVKGLATAWGEYAL